MMKLSSLFAPLLVAVLAFAFFSIDDTLAIPARSGSPGPDNSLFTQVLRDHVKDGLVNYQAIKTDKRFADYIMVLQKTDPNTISEKNRLAFWINAYNAFVIKIVCDQYPIESIMSKTAYVFGKSNFQKKLVTINGTQYSLNDIENDIIRPYGDPRIHFAINCAAMSCPPLRAEAFEPARLSEQMEEQARNFVNDPQKNSFDFARKQARLSRIFDWFKDDFEKHSSGVPNFLGRYLSPGHAEILRTAGKAFKIEHHEYDWKLNDGSIAMGS